MPVPDLEIDPCRCNRVFCCEYSWASVSHILHLEATTGIIHPGIMNDSPLLYWCTLRTCWVMTRLSVKMAVNLIPPTNACPRFRRRPCQLNKSFFPKVLSPCELCIVTFFLPSLCAFPMRHPARVTCRSFYFLGCLPRCPFSYLHGSLE